MTLSGATRTTMRRHIDNVRGWDLPALADDYAADAVMLSPAGAARGREAIMAAFRAAQPVTGLAIASETFDGEHALIVYRADGIPFATDSFVVREGKIVLQTVSVQTQNEARAVADAWAGHIEAGRGMQAMELLAPDARYEIIGTTPLSGVYSGFADVMHRLMAHIGQFPRPPEARCEAVIADGDRAVVLGSGLGEGPYGPYRQPHYAWAMRVTDGRIVELVEYLDTVMVETSAFGSRVVRRGNT